MNIKMLTMLTLFALMPHVTPAAAKDAPAASGVPRAVFEATTLSFPTVVDGVVINRVFTVKNVGSADLRIDKIKTG